MQEAGSDGYASSDEDTSSDSGDSPAAAGSDDDIDMEDLGGRAASGKAASTSQPAMEHQEPAAARDMLTPALRANLSKQGYKLIGEPGTFLLIRIHMNVHLWCGLNPVTLCGVK